LSELKKYSEEELVSLLQNHDEEAFSYLYDNYSAALFGIIYRKVEDKELAEDILQEVFVKIWNNFTNYDSMKGRLFTWMLSITRNFIIDKLRCKEYKKQSKIQNTENIIDNFVDNSSGVERFDSLGIRKHLAHLKNDQKQIIDLAYFSCFTQGEIAKQLSIPLGTVKTRLRTAIIKLREILQY
jgi:RNA polymerase sigma factor (sigma-70 family)